MAPDYHKYTHGFSYYDGTEAQWKAIEISADHNDALFSVTGHYNSAMPDAAPSSASDDIPTGTGQSFRDESDIASWAKEGVGFVSGLTDPVTGNAVMGGTGDGRFSPLAPYTREQACLTALRLSRCGE